MIKCSRPLFASLERTCWTRRFLPLPTPLLQPKGETASARRTAVWEKHPASDHRLGSRSWPPPGNWQSHLGYCNNYSPTTRATPPSVVPYFPAQDPQNALFYFSIPCTFDSAVCGGLSASRLKAVPLVTSYSQRRFREAILSPKPTDKRPWKPPASSPSTVTFPHGRPNIGYPSVDVDNSPSLNPDAKREEPPITIHLPNEPEAKHVVD